MERNRIFSDDLIKLNPSGEHMNTIEWLAEQMPGGFFIYRADESTELLYVNKSVCDIFGCDSIHEFRELTGNTFKGMVHPEDFQKIQASIDNQIADSANSSNMDYVVYRIIRKDKTIRWVDDYGHFATLPGYGKVYYVFIGDITETRQAEEEKERSRTLSLALEEAEQANIAKSAFLSNMSHEIRTPITAILGMNEMIQREAEDDAILEYSENIRKAGESLLGIISDILDFSKIETGRMELVSEEYPLESLVGDLYNLVHFRTEAKGLDLEFVIDPALPSRLIGDEIRVKQIITNLLTNAAKYTEKGGIIFEMKAEKPAGLTGNDAGEQDTETTAASASTSTVNIAVSVTDTGIGIRKEDMDRLFEPFDRLDLKKTRSIEGSGLGLAITRQMLSIMGSELRVESRYEEGSRFYFVLTQRVADETPVGEIDLKAVTQGKREDGRRHSLFTAPGMRLLLVDDTPMNLQVIAGLLKRTRMHIDVAVSGAECIEKFGKNHYNMVFLDYRMPQMNGIETLEELRRIYPEEVKKTPIISLTASAVSGDKEKMLDAGFTDYLSKPVNIEEMERMMIKYLPADSVVMTGEEEEEDDEFSKLPAIIFDYPELDPRKGIDYCGDADDYIFALETYEMSIDAKADQIEADLSAGDAEAFTINVHSLKSTSGAIGATELFEKAKALEAAGKAGDFDTMRRDTPALLDDYRKLKSILRRILDKYDKSEEASLVPLAVVEEERSRMLARALSEAEQANMAKTAFLSNMSHEIRSPMNAIIGLYNIALKKQDLDEETKDIFVKIGASAKHLLSLINDILDISRIESGHVKLLNERFSFGEMIEQINTMIEAQCIEKGLVFECSVCGNIEDYYIGDEMKLTQMLINILGNAVKFTPAPGRVDFRVEEAERNGDRVMVRFTVKDTGIGIDEAYLPDLFEPFSKEKEGKSNSYGSTGLGMAITKNIVDLMSGTIGVSSKKGEGSEFTVTVPLYLTNTRSPEWSGFEGDLTRALIVDDDVTACEHAKMVLSRINMESDYALSGGEALAMLESRRQSGQNYRIVLVDWKMPEMDGIELTRKIRELYGNEEITVILTTYNWDEIMEEAIDAGVDAFLSKPLFAGSIRQEIGDILSDRKDEYKRPVHRASLAGRKVLLAEDMENNAQIMKQVLNLRDIETDLAQDGEEAVKLFENSKEGTYDAILMDIRMPKLDGLEAARQIRAMERGDAGTIPIIALTANAFEEDVRQSLEAGMNAHLSKPVEPDALFAALEKLL